MLGIISDLVFEGLDTSDTNTEHNADAVLVNAFNIHLAVVDSLYGSCHGKLCVAVHLASFLTVDIIGGIEAFHFASELCLEL